MFIVNGYDSCCLAEFERREDAEAFVNRLRDIDAKIHARYTEEFWEPFMCEHGDLYHADRDELFDYLEQKYIAKTLSSEEYDLYKKCEKTFRLKYYSLNLKIIEQG